MHHRTAVKTETRYGEMNRRTLLVILSPIAVKIIPVEVACAEKRSSQLSKKSNREQQSLMVRFERYTRTTDVVPRTGQSAYVQKLMPLAHSGQNVMSREVEFPGGLHSA